MGLRKIPEINDMMNRIEKVQDPNWNGRCSCHGCYWNMWNPKSKYAHDEASKICVSESLDEFKMTPNTENCKGYYSFEEACGHKKGE